MTAGDDDCIQLFDTCTAKHLKSVTSRKYGCRCVTYTHHANCILVASAKGNGHAVRYLSLHDNRCFPRIIISDRSVRDCRWLRFFEGHTQRVSSISMSAANDTFLSAAEDQEVDA